MELEIVGRVNGVLNGRVNGRWGGVLNEVNVVTDDEVNGDGSNVEYGEKNFIYFLKMFCM